MENSGTDWRSIQRVLDGLDEQLRLLRRRLPAEGDADPALRARIEHAEAERAHFARELEQARDALKQKKAPLYYKDYLGLAGLLASQLPQSAFLGSHAHDEMLFIITHQAYELWFKLILHELDCAGKRMSSSFVTAASLGRVVHHLERVIKIQHLLLQQIDVLETMTALDFMDFRDLLFPASGFQSVQFRLFEIKLGLESARRLLPDQRPYYTRLNPEDQEVVLNAEAQPSLFRLVEQWLERTPFLDSQPENYSFWASYRGAVEAMFEADRAVVVRSHAGPGLEDQLKSLDRNRDSFLSFFDETIYNDLVAKGHKRLSFRATQAALLIFLYQDQPMMAAPFRLLQCLVDIDEHLTSWRFKHTMMVQRMLGMKIGTGGSSGFAYLRSTVDHARIFQDFATLATFLIPRRSLPPLPPSISQHLQFAWETSQLEQKTQ